MAEEDSKFVLQGTTGSRFSDVFGCLDTIEAKHEATEKARKATGDGEDLWKKNTGLEDDVIDTSQRKQKSDIGRHDNSGGGIKDNRRERVGSRNEPDRPPGRFKSPRNVPSRRFTPDYKLHPEKWKCYDLSDVGSSEMSDRSNRNAALSFLDDLRKRKESEAGTPNDEEMSEKVVFKKPKTFAKSSGRSEDLQHKAGSDESEKEKHSCHSSGKMVMPEFNFGAGKKYRKKKQTTESGASGEVGDNKRNNISLGHLDDELDDEEDLATQGVKMFKMKRDESVSDTKVKSGLDVAHESDKHPVHEEMDIVIDATSSKGVVGSENSLFKNKGKPKRNIRPKDSEAVSKDDGER